MKKQLVIVWMAVLLICVGLSGCQQQSTYTPTIQKTYLNGWYILRRIDTCDPIDFYSLQNGKGFIFYTNEYPSLRLIINKMSDEDIKIVLMNDRYSIIHTFESSNSKIDEECRIDIPGREFTISNEGGDVDITVLQYFSNVDSSSVTNACGEPIEYLGQ